MPDRAIPLAVDDDARDATFESLLRRGVIVQAGPGRYSLDEAAIARSRPAHRPALAGLAIAGVLALAALVLLD